MYVTTIRSSRAIALALTKLLSFNYLNCNIRRLKGEPAPEYDVLEHSIVAPFSQNIKILDKETHKYFAAA